MKSKLLTFDVETDFGMIRTQRTVFYPYSYGNLFEKPINYNLNMKKQQKKLTDKQRIRKLTNEIEEVKNSHDFRWRLQKEAEEKCEKLRVDLSQLSRVLDRAQNKIDGYEGRHQALRAKLIYYFMRGTTNFQLDELKKLQQEIAELL